MLPVAATVVLGLAGLGSASHIAHREAHAHAHHHALLHARDYIATKVEVVTETITSIIYEDETSSSVPSTTSTSSVAPAVFIEKAPPSSSSTTTTTSPTPTPTPTTTSSVVVPTPAAANGGAAVTSSPVASSPATSAAAAGPANPNEFTVTVVNKHTAAVSTQHTNGNLVATSAGAPLVAGTMAPGATATFAVPYNWVGNFAFGDAKYPINDACSLWEGNYKVWGPGYFGGLGVMDADISFILGFSLPATIACSGAVVAGCNKNLFDLAACPVAMIGGSCRNSDRGDQSLVAASSFFKPCDGLAWCFEENGKADSQCTTGNTMTVYLGAGAPAK